jgi:hypothetical protein
MLQVIDAENAIRADVFRACGGTMDRTSKLTLPFGTTQIVFVADLAARTGRLTLDLAGGVPTPSKYAFDFLRVAALTDPEEAETAWRDHRKGGQPATFKKTNRLLQTLVRERQNLLVTPSYSNDVAEVCQRCQNTNAFRIADPKAILSLLGYV